MNSLLKSVENFRDMGGQTTLDGRRLKCGLIFRSGSLDKISERDKEKFSKLNISKVIDFRDKAEAASSPDFSGDFIYLNLPALKVMNPELASPEKTREYLRAATKESVDKNLDEFIFSYIDMPFNNEAFKQTLLSLNDCKPFLFHCASGKDRTGIAAALISLSLGIPEKTVTEQYLLSNKYRAKVLAETLIKAKIALNKDAYRLIRYISFTREEFISAALSEIKKRYDGFGHYLMTEYGIDHKTVEDWKEFYLE